MNGLRAKELLRRQMRTGAGVDCGPECDAPLAMRPVNPNLVPYKTPRNWWVVSSLNLDGTVRAVTSGLGILFASQFYMFEVPPGYGLFSLGVEYTSIGGQIQIGDNNPPIPVSTTVAFNLDQCSFPVPLCGPLKVYIQGGVNPGDPVVPVPVNFHAFIAEVRECDFG